MTRVVRVNIPAYSCSSRSLPVEQNGNLLKYDILYTTFEDIREIVSLFSNIQYEHKSIILRKYTDYTTANAILAYLYKERQSQCIIARLLKGDVI